MKDIDLERSSSCLSSVYRSKCGPPTRFHLHESVVQNAVAHAASEQSTSCSARTDVSTRTVYTYVLSRGPLGVDGPVDRL